MTLDTIDIFAYPLKVQSKSETEYLTAAEAAERIGVTPQAVRDLIRKGHLPGSRQFGRGRTAPWQVPAVSVQRYLDDQATKKTE